MQNFRTYDLALELHRTIAKECADRGVRGELLDQAKRASISVVLNLSEGCGKSTEKGRRHFYSIALGSLREVQACCDLMDAANSTKDLSGKVAGSLYRLIQNPGRMPLA